MNQYAIAALVIGALVLLAAALYFVPRLRQKAAATSIVGNGLPTAGDGNTPEQNLIGPVVLMPDGSRVNKSVGCPPTLQPLAGAIGYVDVPQSDIKGVSPTPNPIDGSVQYIEPDGHLHYVTANMAIPAGATGLECVFDIIAEDGSEVRPRTGPDLPSTLTLYLQRQGDNFSGTGVYVYYRWWNKPTVLWQPQTGWQNRGRITITAPFDLDHWFEEDSENHDAAGKGIPNDPARRAQFFQQLLANCQLIGFTCGGGDGNGHGIFAVRGKGNVRIVLVSRRFT